MNDTLPFPPGFTWGTATGAMGGNLPHENTMPTLTASFCIAWAGIYPSQQ